jgi:hypothetical protein
MIDKNKISKQTYNEQIDLLGYDKAEVFLNREQFNFRAIQMKILSESLKRRFGKRFWFSFWIFALIIAMIYELLRTNLII